MIFHFHSARQVERCRRCDGGDKVRMPAVELLRQKLQYRWYLSAFSPFLVEGLFGIARIRQKNLFVAVVEF